VCILLLADAIWGECFCILRDGVWSDREGLKNQVIDVIGRLNK